MTDRELLELAAKAAEIDLHVEWTDEGPTGRYRIGCDGDAWNPLTDDGDALRLAVRTGEPFIVRARCVTTMGGLIENFDPAVQGDDLRATRRAIVRAAAALGAQTEGMR